jgi:16S rRNA (uracil1498-N3)-methyltransferase
MALKSVYLPHPPTDDDPIRISGDEHHHLTVARVQEGESIEILDGRGAVWTAEVLSVDRRETIARVVRRQLVENSGPELILALSLIKTSAFELALEKVVEVGVTRIVPFTAHRSNATAGRRTDRWQRIVIEAAKQSKRYYLPVLDPPATFSEILKLQAATRILFAERGGGPLKSALAGPPTLFLIGPEGGWTEEELEAAHEKGFHRVSLGESILRSETAAITATALLRYELQQFS